MTTTLAPDVDTPLQHAFRGAMGQVAAPVAVVTTLRDGVPYGTTVSAFMSLSMSPPMLSFALDAGSRLLGRIAVGSVVGVNVLAAHQSDLALRFASRSDEDRFAGIGWRIENDAPALAERHAWVALRVSRLVEAGDHTLVLGDVTGAQACSTSGPLTYWCRSFGTHAPR
ncbi:MAG: flavin reductase family protein [Aeromicrobium sp.]|uniref:flavin reductase family protein n=1 Tax=Aeromicrobium sp. TaxID=1871063 RepID=UPI0039E360D1